MRTLKWIGLLAFVLALTTGWSAAQAASPAQQGGGQICVQAFEDKNGNGRRDEADEPLLTGVGFTLSSETGRIGTYTTDGNSEPYCFGNLPAGQYTVQARQSAKKGEPTTPGQWVIPLANNAEYSVAYGVQLDGTSAEGAPGGASSRPAASASGSMSVLGRIVLGLLGIAMFGAAGFLAYRLLLRLRSQ